MKMPILTLLFLLLVSVSANAAIEVPAKAVWSVTDIDTLQFCDKCDISAVSAEKRQDNYKRTIADTVYMGAKHILVHAINGDARATRLAEFKAALLDYNSTAAADKKACMAIMYADYGTIHTNANINAQWLSAYSDNSAYCTINGAPVIATLEDRSDKTCTLSVVSNILTRLRSIAAPNNITSAHWIAAFGETSEFTNWQSDCQGDLDVTNITVTYSYLEMANDNSAFAADSASRATSVVNAGGRYILGVPSTSATNCGDFCGTDSDSSAYSHTSFSGWLKTLSSFRSGINNIAYTFGPGGPTSKDQFASTSVMCDTNDLATSSTDCASLAAASKALVPGLVTSDGEEPPTGEDPQCEVEAPAPAKELGLTHLAFCDSFKYDSVARGANANDRLIGGNKKWAAEDASHFGTLAYQPPGDFKHNPTAGTMTLEPSVNQYQQMMQTHNKRGSTVTGFYIDRASKGYYFEWRMKPTKFNTTYEQKGNITSNIAIWSYDLCHWDAWPALCPDDGKFLETDHSEFKSGAINPRFWRQNPGGSGAERVAADCSNKSNDITAAPLNVWKTHGMRAEPASGPAGTPTLRRYGNGEVALFKNKNNCPQGEDWFPHITTRRHAILIGMKRGDAAEFDFVRVWIHPDDK